MFSERIKVAKEIYNNEKSLIEKAYDTKNKKNVILKKFTKNKDNSDS